MKTINLKEGFKLNGRDMPEVAELCKQIGIRHLKDLDRFMAEPENQGLDLLSALRNWRKLLGPDFQITESLKEDIKKTYSPSSEEYSILSKVADILTKSSDSKDYIVKDVYLDYGLNWRWTTIVAQDRNDNSIFGGYQVLNPRDYRLLLSAGTYEQGLNNVLEQEKITLKESLGKDYSDIPDAGSLRGLYANRVRPNSLPGLDNVDKFTAALQQVADKLGTDTFKVRSTKFFDNVSNEDLNDEWMAIHRKGWSVFRTWDKSMPGFNEIYLISKIEKKEAMKLELSPEDALRRIIDDIKVNAPRARGEKQPAFDSTKINESEFADGMRYKHFEFTVNDGRNVSLKWITQEPFDNSDAEKFTKEIERAVKSVMDKHTYSKPINLSVDVESRDKDSSYSTQINIDGTVVESFDGKSFEADVTTRNGDYIYVSDKEAVITYNDLVIEDVPYGSVHDTNYYEEPYYDTTSVDMSGFELTLDPNDILEFVGDRLPEEAYDTLNFDNEDEVDEYIINNLEKILTDVGQDLVEYYRDEAEEKAMDEAIDKANDEYYYGGYDEKLKESADNKANIIEFPNGNYVHTKKVGNKIIAGSATNTGIIPEYQVKIEDTKDKALQDLYDLIITTHPEYLEECSLNEELSAEMQSAKQFILDAFKENEITSKLKGDAIECSYDRSVLSIISKVLTSHDYFLSDFDEEDPMELFVYSPLNGEQHQNIYVTVKFNEKITVSFSESELEGFEFDECNTVVEEVQYDDIDEVEVDDTKHKYVVTEYELYPIYEPAEGGYYYAGSSIEAQTECDSLEEARKVFEEKAEEYGYEIMGVNRDIARSEDTGYVGEGGFIQIESDTNEIFDKVGSSASGWHPYQ